MVKSIPHTVIDKLAEKAAAVGDSGDSMRLSQAANNIANAYLALANVPRTKQG